MKVFRELSADDQQKIRAKLDELHSRTGKVLGYDIVQGSGDEHATATLEVIVDSRCQMRTAIPRAAENVAELICQELEKALADSANQLSARAAAAEV